MKDIMTVGLDLAKNRFYAVALNRHGKRQWRKCLNRRQLTNYFAQLPASHVAMEACGGAHYWARTLEALGHEVVLLPPQHVKAYLRGQKNDYNDAEAIAEAHLHGRIRPVQAKSVAEQELHSFHRLREQLIRERTRLINQGRGLLSEFGIVIAKGPAHFRRNMPEILEDAENGLPGGMRELLARHLERYRLLEQEIDWYDQQLKQRVSADEHCQRLMSIPGFGPVVSSAFRSALGDGCQFRRGRDASASLGLVPRQHSSGGKDRLLGITKRGDGHLRTLLVHAARSVVRHAERKDDRLSVWIQDMLRRRGYNKTVVALANKLVRIGWVVLSRGEYYQPQKA
jgi:transposase